METTNSNFSSMTLLLYWTAFFNEATLFSDGLYFDRLYNLVLMCFVLFKAYF
jgi:hypothetical protein